jgi:hypothetical protein
MKANARGKVGIQKVEINVDEYGNEKIDADYVGNINVIKGQRGIIGSGFDVSMEGRKYNTIEIARNINPEDLTKEFSKKLNMLPDKTSIKKVNSVITEIKKTKEDPITPPTIPVEKEEIIPTNQVGSVDSSFAVTSPLNILTKEGYALGKYASGMKCPQGDFIPHATASNYFCTQKNSGITISGWEIIRYDSPIPNISKLKIYAENNDDGCSGTYCGKSTSTKIFATSKFDGANTDWRIIGMLSMEKGVSSPILPFTEITVDAILVARGGDGGARPDPRWYWIELLE